MTSATPKPRAGEHVPSWVPSTHHVVPQPAGHECAAWYEWANPSACDILYALAHIKGEADAIRERERDLVETLQTAEALRPKMLKDFGYVPEYVLDFCNRARALAKHGR